MIHLTGKCMLAILQFSQWNKTVAGGNKFSHGVRRKAFPCPTHGMMRCSGKIYWSRNKRLPPGSQHLIHGQEAQTHSTMDEVQPCLPQVQKKGKVQKCYSIDPATAGHSLIQSMSNLSEAQSMSLSSWLSLCCQLHSGLGCAAVFTSVLGAWAWVFETAMERECANKGQIKVCYWEMLMLSFYFITSALGKTNHSFRLTNLFPSPSWACAGLSP